eukprot:1696169-Amphidinium_carterae.1
MGCSGSTSVVGNGVGDSFAPSMRLTGIGTPLGFWSKGKRRAIHDGGGAPFNVPVAYWSKGFVQ